MSAHPNFLCKQISASLAKRSSLITDAAVVVTLLTLSILLWASNINEFYSLSLENTVDTILALSRIVLMINILYSVMSFRIKDVLLSSGAFLAMSAILIHYRSVISPFFLAFLLHCFPGLILGQGAELGSINSKIVFVNHFGGAGGYLMFDTSDFLIGTASTHEKLLHLLGNELDDSHVCHTEFRRLTKNVFYIYVEDCS